MSAEKIKPGFTLRRDDQSINVHEIDDGIVYYGIHTNDEPTLLLRKADVLTFSAGVTRCLMDGWSVDK